MENKKKETWIPPDPVALQLTVKKKIVESPNAKYIQIRVFKKYKINTTMQFEKDQINTPSFPHSEDYPMWLLTKMYIPVSSEVRRFNKISKKESGIYDRIGIAIPDKVTVELEIPKLWPVKVRKDFSAYLQQNCNRLFNMVYKSAENNKLFILLTQENWSVVDTEPNQEKNEVFTLKTDRLDVYKGVM